MLPITFIVIALTIVASSFGHSRIVGGHNAEDGAYPYQVSYQWGLFGNHEHACGASILSPTWVVTSAHCILMMPMLNNHTIVAGSTELNGSNPERQVIIVDILMRIPHPNFTVLGGPFDIGLMKLETPLNFTDFVQPISLPEADYETEGQVTLTGWGFTLDGNNGSEIVPDHLQTVDVPLISIDECRKAVDILLDGQQDNLLDDETNVCTGPLTGGISACGGVRGGDSGSPIAQDNTLIGIVSWDFTPCGREGAPTVYTKVSKYIDFIQKYVDDLP